MRTFNFRVRKMLMNSHFFSDFFPTRSRQLLFSESTLP